MFKTVQIQHEARPYSLAVAEDNIGSIISESGSPYERDLLRVTLALLRPGDWVVDVGANIGNHTVFWAVNGLQVDAFEPNPAAWTFIDRNVTRNGLAECVRIHKCALGSIDRRVCLEVPDSANLGSARLIDQPRGDHCTTQVHRLDDVLAARTARIRLIKIDTEGFESEVLKGAAEVLADRPILVVEEHGREARREVAEILRPFGYVRVPVSLAYSPTFIHLARRDDIERLLITRAFWNVATLRIVKDIARFILGRR